MRRQAIDRDLDRILSRLRYAIHERGFTPIEVQEALGWGRSCISQLLTKQKTPRVEQILMILNVIEVKPRDFFGEIFQFGEDYGTLGKAQRPAGRAVSPLSKGPGDLGAEVRRLRSLLEGMVSVLERKNLITAGDLAAAVERVRCKGAFAEAPETRHADR